MSEKRQETGSSGGPEYKMDGATSVLREFQRGGADSDVAFQKLRDLLRREIEKRCKRENLKHHDFSDITQEVLLTYVKTKTSFPSSGEFAGFLVKRISYRIVDAIRKEKRWGSSQLDDADEVVDTRTVKKNWERIMQDTHDDACMHIRQLLKDSQQLSDASKFALELRLLENRTWNDVLIEANHKFPEATPSLRTLKRNCKQLLERVDQKMGRPDEDGDYAG